MAITAEVSKEKELPVHAAASLASQHHRYAKVFDPSLNDDVGSPKPFFIVVVIPVPPDPPLEVGLLRSAEERREALTRLYGGDLIP